MFIFVGGEQADFERFQPLFHVSIGDHIAYMGPVGSGHVTIWGPTNPIGKEAFAW